MYIYVYEYVFNPTHSVEIVKQAVVDLDKHLLFLKGEGTNVCIIFMHIVLYI
jgi:hypothetical protein